MAPADVAVPPAPEERRPRHGEGEARLARQAGRLPGREQLRPLGEGGVVLPDSGLELARGARPVAQRRARMRAANGLGQPVDERVGKVVPLGDAVERRVLVEPPHMADPLDDLAVSAEPEARRAS